MRLHLGLCHLPGSCQRFHHTLLVLGCDLCQLQRLRAIPIRQCLQRGQEGAQAGIHLCPRQQRCMVQTHGWRQAVFGTTALQQALKNRDALSRIPLCEPSIGHHAQQVGLVLRRDFRLLQQCGSVGTWHLCLRQMVLYQRRLQQALHGRCALCSCNAVQVLHSACMVVGRTADQGPGKTHFGAPILGDAFVHGLQGFSGLRQLQISTRQPMAQPRVGGRQDHRLFQQTYGRAQLLFLQQTIGLQAQNIGAQTFAHRSVVGAYIGRCVEDGQGRSKTLCLQQQAHQATQSAGIPRLQGQCLFIQPLGRRRVALCSADLCQGRQSRGVVRLLAQGLCDQCGSAIQLSSVACVICLLQQSPKTGSGQ